ncbi:S8 family serine peptidase [Candidatus Woesearchaeota archaeon]|nr:S8 family serine peptidase [Candidatus Woesearchaeota archaeon]
MYPLTYEKREVAFFVAVLLFVLGLSSIIFLTGGSITGAVVGASATGPAAGLSAADSDRIAEDVLDERVLETVADEEEASVIVVLKSSASSDSEAVREQQAAVLETLSPEEKKLFGFTIQEKEFTVEQQYATLPAFAGMVTEAGLEELAKNPAVEKVVLNEIQHIFLDTSVPLIEAPKVWNITVNGTAITGDGETVCVIDTGVDYTHPAMGGSLGVKVLGGYDFVNDDADPMDDHGHGTHVAGIAASTDATYKGVAPEAKIAAVKVCNSQGACADADVLAGMDWCIYNATLYNISAISISLGGGQYSSSCDADDSFISYAQVINAAVGKNISVVAATGNSGAGGIAGPACVKNATKVTASTDGDTIASFASRHQNFPEILAAPGSSIISLKKGGGVTIPPWSGTSMSTPHVSGAIALLRQYWRLAYGIVPTPEQLATKLRLTGVPIADGSTGATFSRIAILEAVQPYLNFTAETPQNGTVLNSTPAPNSTAVSSTPALIIFAVTADDPLSSALLEWQYPNGTVQNQTMAALDEEQKWFSLNLSLLEEGLHAYRVYGSDAVGTTGKTSLRMLQLAGNSSGNSSENSSSPLPTSLSLQLTSPLNNSRFGRAVISFNATVNASQPVSSVKFVVTNVSLNETMNITLFASSFDNISWNASLDVLLLSDGDHSVMAFVNDTTGRENQSTASNFTIDRTSPIFSDVQADATENASIITFSLDEAANASIVYWPALAESLFVGNASFSTVHTFFLTALNSSTLYSYNLTACDGFSNCRTAGVYTFTTLALNVSNQTGLPGNESGLPENNSSNSSPDNSSGNNNSSNDSSNNSSNSDGSSDENNSDDSSANNSSSSSGSSGSSGSSAGGGGSSSSGSETESASEPVPEESSNSLTTAAVADESPEPSVEEVPEPVEELPEVATGSAEQVIQLNVGEITEVAFTDALIPIRKLIVEGRTAKDVTISVENLNALPEGVLALENAYQYLEMKGLASSDFSGAQAQFVVQKSWQEEQAAAGRVVVLLVHEDDGWQPLSTKRIGTQDDAVLYEAEVPHFSLFAIGAKEKSGFLVGGAIADIFSGASSGSAAIVGFFLLVLLGSGILVLILRKRSKTAESNEDERLLRFE